MKRCCDMQLPFKIKGLSPVDSGKTGARGMAP
jgi:hypothetical protein